MLYRWRSGARGGGGGGVAVRWEGVAGGTETQNIRAPLPPRLHTDITPHQTPARSVKHTHTHSTFSSISSPFFIFLIFCCYCLLLLLLLLLSSSLFCCYRTVFFMHVCNNFFSLSLPPSFQSWRREGLRQWRQYPVGARLDAPHTPRPQSYTRCSPWDWQHLHPVSSHPNLTLLPLPTTSPRCGRKILVCLYA